MSADAILRALQGLTRLRVFDRGTCVNKNDLLHSGHVSVIDVANLTTASKELTIISRIKLRSETTTYIFIHHSIETIMDEIYREIYGQLKDTPIISIHEHIYPERLMKEPLTLLQIIQGSYLYCDLVSSGMQRKVWEQIVRDEKIDPTHPPIPPLKELVRALKRTIMTSYYRALFLGLKELFGIESLNEQIWDEWKRVVRDKRSRNGWERHVFDKANVELALQDNFWALADFHFPEEYFAPVFRVDRLLQSSDPTFVNKKGLRATELAERWGIDISTFSGYCDMVDEALEKAKNYGVVAIKIALAYYRSLNFERGNKDEAERAYKLRDRSYDDKFCNYMVHYILRKCEEDLKMPVLIHTGIQTRNANLLVNSDPKLLNPLFIEYPGVNFIILHGGYPFSRDAAVMAKNFPNVHLDVTWLSMITGSGYKMLLKEFLELVPANKIIWGSDSDNVEQMLGHVMLFRHLTSETLAKMADERIVSVNEAVEIGKWIFRENAIEIFNL